MLGIKLICVGKMREKYYIDAFSEYEKRLSAYCRFDISEINEERLPDSPSDNEIMRALSKEGDLILKTIPKDSYVIALCVEGKQMPSEKLASVLREREGSGKPRVCFIVGGSYGLSDQVKKSADCRLSMSEMTFPHHLARVMLVEQIYRGFKINEGSAYHK
ncbi:MAG: 23S rRNA (pseudouridine(1915)-N(3))-methyltransferase RlmH [Eubacteriales bacterium]|nr:23S rRNA (pseudouridine(1915)-N(3))-methyltransferase RlmH [Eubacteriales bacterium]